MHTTAAIAGEETVRATQPRDLLPLPVVDLSLEEGEWTRRRAGQPVPSGGEQTDAVLEFAAGVQAWVWLLAAALNYMHEGRGRTAASKAVVLGPPSEAQQQCVQHLRADATYFLNHTGGKVPERNWMEVLARRTVRYDGEEVGSAQALSWERLAPALPKPGTCGLVDAAEIAQGGVREALLNPELTTLPVERWPQRPLRARCQYIKEDRERIIEGILGCGLCVVVEQSSLVHVGGVPLLNGWFGVGKGKFLRPDLELPEEEILRFIMNFQPANALLTPILGDVEKLPYMGQWSNLQLLAWQYFAWTSEDIRILAACSTSSVSLTLWSLGSYF